MTHHTKDKGDLGVAKIYADLVEKGFLVLFPTSEHTPFDVVAYKNCVFTRIQVKARTEVDGAVIIPVVTSWADKNGTHLKEYDLNEIDYFAIYNITRKEIYYVPISKIKVKRAFTLRVGESKNMNKAAVNFAKDFTTIE
jgi:hypothetical protein